MNRIMTGLTLALLLAGPALALTAQQEKMKTCNAEAAQKQLSGDARKSFMKDCLGAGSAAGTQHASLTPQQQKMKDCNASASAQNLKGEPRKEFISACLKK